MTTTAAPALQVPVVFNAASYFVDRNVDEGRGEAVAIVSGDRQFTYRQIQEMSNRTGNLLLGLGAIPEQWVIMILLDGPEFAATFFGAIKAGRESFTAKLDDPSMGKDFAWGLYDLSEGVKIPGTIVAGPPVLVDKNNVGSIVPWEAQLKQEYGH